MSDAEASVIREARRDWVTEHREKYLRSGGVEGHIEDLTAVNGRTFGTHLLLKYKGRKSGRIFITPLSYADIGGEVVIVGSKGGADTHPEWYLNVVASPDIEFQIGTQAFRATWREPEGRRAREGVEFHGRLPPVLRRLPGLDDPPDSAGDDAAAGRNPGVQGKRRDGVAELLMRVLPRHVAGRIRVTPAPSTPGQTRSARSAAPG